MFTSSIAPRREPARSSSAPSTRPGAFEPLAIASTLLLALGVAAYDLVDPAGLTRQLMQEHSDVGAGAIEDLTFYALLPGIACGVWTLARRSAFLPSRLARVWVLAWTAACVYFAGEEVSWGYWAFGWETPEAIAQLNDQGETNLHNMSSWLDQKPRALVELFVVVAGLVLPVLASARGRTLMRTREASELERWIVPPVALVPAALFFLAVRIAKLLPERFERNLGDSELRELAVAWFLALYLISFAVRAQRAAQETASADGRIARDDASFWTQAGEPS